MSFDKTFGLWSRPYAADAESVVYDEISRISSPVGTDGRRMIYGLNVLTEIKLSNDGTEHRPASRSLVRVDVSPRGDIPAALDILLKSHGFEKASLK